MALCDDRCERVDNLHHPAAKKGSMSVEVVRKHLDDLVDDHGSRNWLALLMIHFFPSIAKKEEMVKGCNERLTLRELEALTGAFAAVLLPLSLAGIASEIAEIFQFASDLFAFLDKRPANAEAGRDSLSFQTSAFDSDNQVYFLRIGEFLERGQDRVSLELQREILLESAAVDVDDPCPSSEAD
jgi:hypothetical protein